MKVAILTIMLLLFTSVTAQIINLEDLTLNDSLIKELNIEKLTNILGRPSAIETREIVAGLVGPALFYHDLGLYFDFFGKSRDPQQRVFMITIYLTQTWDKYHNRFYLPYSGSLIPKVNPNMKANDILQLFEQFPTTVTTPEERKKELVEALKRLKGIKMGKITIYHSISIDNNGTTVILLCEELTKFLERISIIYKK